MKNLILLAAFILFGISCNTATETKETPEAKITTITYKVEGMTCSGCENSVTSTLAAISGVDSVAASHVDSTVYVSFDANSVVDADLIKAIEAKGYAVNGKL